MGEQPYARNMPGPVEKLERAYNDAVEASGPAFFRLLRDYERLLSKDRAIKKAKKKLIKRAKAADKKFVKEDNGFVRELQTFRNNFVARVPEADDSAEQRPEMNGQRAPARSAEGHEWAYTLANFDAVREDRDDRILIGQGLDHGRSGMMAAILDAKILDLRHPLLEPATGVMNREEQDQRPDLDGLHAGVTEIRRKEEAAYRRAELAAEDNGFFALFKVEHVSQMLEPQDPLPMNTEEEKLTAFSQALREAGAGYHHLREAIRPPEAGTSRERSAQEALDYHEGELKAVLERLHRPLRDQLEASRQVPRWRDLSGGTKATLAVGIPGLVLAGAGIALTIILSN